MQLCNAVQRFVLCFGMRRMLPMRATLLLLLLLISASMQQMCCGQTGQQQIQLPQAQMPYLIPAGLVELPFCQTCLVNGPGTCAWVD